MNRTLDDIIKENNRGLKNFTRGRGNRRGNRRVNRNQQRNDYDQRDNYAPRRVHNMPRRDNYRPKSDSYRPRNNRMMLDRELTPRYERNSRQRQNRREYGFNNGMSKVSKIVIILFYLIRDQIEDIKEAIGETEDKKDHLIIELKIQSSDQSVKEYL